MILAAGRLGLMASAHSVRARRVSALPARSGMMVNAAKDVVVLAASRLAAVDRGVADRAVGHLTVAATSRAGRASRSSDGFAHAYRRR